MQTCPPSIPGSARSPPCSPLLPRGLSPSRLDMAASETCRLLPAVSRTAAKGNLQWRGEPGSGSPGAEPHPERLLPALGVMGAGAPAVAQMAVRGGGGEAACGGSLAGAAQTREPGVRSRRVCSDTCSVSLQRKEQRRGCALSGEAALGGLPEERMLLNEALPRCPRPPLPSSLWDDPAVWGKARHGRGFALYGADVALWELPWDARFAENR